MYMLILETKKTYRLFYYYIKFVKTCSISCMYHFSIDYFAAHKCGILS